MKILFKILFLIFLSLMITSCTNKKTIIIDGHTYIQLSAGKTNDNGINDVELWQRIGITNKYYTPSIDGKFMMPIMK